MKKAKFIRLISKALALIITLTTMLCIATPASAASAGVEEVLNGVFMFNFELPGYHYDDGSPITWWGSCFLINNDTIITCNHCVHFSEAEYLALERSIGLTKDEVNKQMKYTVTITRDFSIPATLLNSSENMDFAILKLSQPINNKVPLKIRDSRTVKASETVYSVGFPASKDSTGMEKHDPSDIAYQNGLVNRTQFEKLADGFGSGLVVKCDVLQVSNTSFSSGNSGGPLVDENGAVVGICSYSETNPSGDISCYAIAMNQVTDVFDAIGIEWYKWTEENPPITSHKPDTDPPVTGGNDKVDTSALAALIAKAENKKSEDYTEDSYEDLTDALIDAKAALLATSQSKVDSAAAVLKGALDDLEKADGSDKSSLNPTVLIGIAAAVVIIIVLLLILILGKKNKPAQPAPAQPAPAQQAYSAAPNYPNAAPQQQAPFYGSAPTAAHIQQGAGETTVLSQQGSGETTVLSQNIMGGTLIRFSNNERIAIRKDGFAIGREPSSVDYCISGNSNVSRVHARFFVRNGSAFIVDNKAANGTVINGVKAYAGQEVELKDGDVILLADEKFIYRK